jgi:hypothetical protein
LVVVGILLPRSPESEILAWAEMTDEGDVLSKGRRCGGFLVVVLAHSGGGFFDTVVVEGGVS